MKANFRLLGLLCPRIMQMTNRPIGFYKSAIAVFFILLCFVFGAKAQERGVSSAPVAAVDSRGDKSGIFPLKIGDKIPDELWDLPLEVVNHPNGKRSITLNDYKGKLIILDFWATWCGACLTAFSNNNEIQKKYENQLKIVLINTELKKDPLELGAFLNDYSSRHNTELLRSSVVKDTMLRKIIPFRVIPHYTWIDADGIIVAATSSEEVNLENISKIIKREEATINNKRERFDVDIKKPFLFNSNLIEDGKLKTGSALAGRIDGVSSRSFFPNHFNSSFARIFMLNSSILRLLRSAFQLEGEFNSNRIILNVENPSKYKYSGDKGVKFSDWVESNSYSYELYSPAKSKEEILRKMQSDLLEYFELNVLIEQRTLDCWILTSNDEELEVFKKETQDTSRYSFTPKWDLQTMADYLDARLDIPVVNGSSFADEILLDLPEDPSDLTQLHTVLNNAGIYLKKVKKDFPVFVVTELK